MEQLLFTDLFSPRPDDWALRGDLHLWDELSTYLAEVLMPNSANAVRQIIASAIESLTGTTLDGTNVVVVDRYPDDGLSSRHVSLRYWNETALPLLVSRFRGQPPTTRDYFAELYVAGLFGDAGWAVYFPKRDVGFDLVVSKEVGGSVILRPVQVKGLYPTPEKRDRNTFGFAGVLSAVHPEMVVVMPFFSATERGAAPDLHRIHVAGRNARPRTRRRSLCSMRLVPRHASAAPELPPFHEPCRFEGTRRSRLECLSPEW